MFCVHHHLHSIANATKGILKIWWENSMSWQPTRHRQQYTERQMNFKSHNYSDGFEVFYIKSTLKGSVEENKINCAMVAKAGREHDLCKKSTLLYPHFWVTILFLYIFFWSCYTWLFCFRSDNNVHLFSGWLCTFHGWLSHWYTFTWTWIWGYKPHLKLIYCIQKLPFSSYHTITV